MENNNTMELNDVVETGEEGHPEEVAPAEETHDHEHPKDDISIDDLATAMKMVIENVKIAENNWRITQQEYDLKDPQLRALYDYNLAHRVDCPEDATDEEKQNFDRFNGLNGITEEEVKAIFGENHPIYGTPHSITIQHIKESLSDFIFYLSVIREYDSIYKEYMSTVGAQEEADIQELRSIAAQETDPEKKAKMDASLKEYDRIRTLEFLNDISDDEVDRIKKAAADKDKISYYINRATDKMKSFGMPKKVILDLASFETRYLGEETYAAADNMLLMYFLSMIVYATPAELKDVRRKASFILIGADKIVHHSCSDEEYEETLANIRAFADRFVSSKGE